MKTSDSNSSSRRTFLAGAPVAAFAGLALADALFSSTASAQDLAAGKGEHFQYFTADVLAADAKALQAAPGNNSLVKDQNFTVVMTPGVIRRIVQANPSCVMLKHEDWPGLEKISTLRGFEQDGSMRHISILCGNGGLFLDFETERGADGAMTGYAFPDMLADVVRLGASGQRDAAHDLFDAHLPLLRYEQQPGIGLAVRKYVMARRGIIASDVQRKPGGTLGAKAKAEVEYLLTRLARIDARAALQQAA